MVEIDRRTSPRPREVQEVAVAAVVAAVVAAAVAVTVEATVAILDQVVAR